MAGRLAATVQAAGNLAASASAGILWTVPPADLAGYPMGRAMRKRVDDYLRGGGPFVA